MVSKLKTLVYLVDHDKLVKKLAEKLKTSYPQFRQPVWAPFVKTATTNLEPPADQYWWYTRAGSVLRKLAVYDTLGIEELSSHYGGRRRKGQQKERSMRGSSGHIRRILKGLEEANLVQKGRTGRKLSPAGASLVEAVCRELIEGVVQEKPYLSAYLGETP
jgi:small subunit ribosomal protein S19e